MEPVETADDRGKLDRIGAYVFSYLLAIVLLGTLIYFSGIWNFLANTRLLSVLIDAGVVEYHDAQHGWIRGVPDLDYFVRANDPIKWHLVRLAGLIFIVFWLLKTLQFQIILRFTGVHATYTQVARAYLYGLGINRLVPFNLGHKPIVDTLAVHQGAPESKAAQALFLAEIFVVVEIAIFAVFGAFSVGWSVWIAQLFWALVIFTACWLMIRPTGEHGGRSVLMGSRHDVVAALKAIAHRPVTLSGLTLLSVLALALEDVGAYVIAMAFTSDHVILNVSFSTLMMAVVAGYIARLIPITPGGIGQFEWGFAAGLYLGGLGFPECVTIAILDNVIRYISGTIVYFFVYFLRVDYSFELFSLSRKSAKP
jgi:uncharacterized membrane protein YbhN (UPF0104 family)